MLASFTHTGLAHCVGHELLSLTPRPPQAGLRMVNIALRHRAAAGIIAGVVVVVTVVAVGASVRGASSARESGTIRQRSVHAAATSDPQDATQAVTLAFEQWLDGSHPDASLAVIQDAARLQPALAEAAKTLPGVESYRGQVNSVQFTNSSSAEVNYSVFAGRVLIRANLTGIAVLVDGRWLVSSETVCNLLALNGIACPQDPYVPQSTQ